MEVCYSLNTKSTHYYINHQKRSGNSVCDKEKKEMGAIKKENVEKSRKNLILSFVKKACDKNDKALKKLSE